MAKREEKRNGKDINKEALIVVITSVIALVGNTAVWALEIDLNTKDIVSFNFGILFFLTAFFAAGRIRQHEEINVSESINSAGKKAPVRVNLNNKRKNLSQRRFGMKKERSFTVAIEPCEEGGYFGTCPTLPGCHVQGETYEETLSELKAAIEAMIEDYLEDGDELPTGEISITTIKVPV